MKEYINLWHHKTALTPNWLMKNPEVSFGAKCCYGMLALYENTYGSAKLYTSELAHDLGATEEDTKKFIAELIVNNLIIEHNLSERRLLSTLSQGEKDV